MNVLLEARHVTKVFGGGMMERNRTVALDDFSLALTGDPPSVTAVVGESGSGKTTLARLLLGLERPTEGEVLYGGTSLHKLSGAALHAFRRNVQVVFQDPFEVYNPFYPVDHVLEVPIDEFGLAKSKQERRTLMEEALQAVGLRSEETLGRRPHELSGGQRQRIMVARALLSRPRLIFADEPVSMIDASLRATVLGNLRQLNEEMGISIIYITHDLATAYQISESIIVLYSGSVMEAGDVERVVRQPQHPYTQLLIGSIPRANPHRKRDSRAVVDTSGVRAQGESFCKFVDRCPRAMPQCGVAAPPLFRSDQRRLVACYLFEDCPSVRSEDLATVLAKPAG